jgi:hypothetical protein
MELGSLVVPVLLSTVAVIVLNVIACVVLPHHRSDFRKLPDEDGMLDRLREQAPAPGLYMAPHYGPKSDHDDPVLKAKLDRGPLAMIMVRGPMNMGRTMGAWALHLLVVGFVTAYVLRHSLQPGAPFVEVMRLATTVSFATHVLGPLPNAIWWAHPWPHTLKTMADGVAYALATGAIFAWRWP